MTKLYLLDQRSDVKHFYTVSDIFLFPTKYEPFGSVVLEAMNYANAVITTKQCGGGELLDKEFLMENSKDYSIASKIDEILENDDKLKNIKARNLQIVKDFTIEKNVEKTLEVINEIIN